MKFTVESFNFIVLVVTVLVALNNGVNGNDKSVEETEVVEAVGRPGPQYYATRGEPWPKPQLRHIYNDTFMVVRPSIFRFQVKKL